MGITKTHLFNESQNEIAAMLKAMAHPARVAIIEHLIKVNVCIGGDLVNELGLAQATISQHLKELKTAGLINGTVEGKSVCYCVNKQAVQRLQNYFTAIPTEACDTNNQCC